MDLAYLLRFVLFPVKTDLHPSNLQNPSQRMKKS